MLQGFKQFIFRGNVLDLAVAVVMGGAFGAVRSAMYRLRRVVARSALRRSPNPPPDDPARVF